MDHMVTMTDEYGREVRFEFLELIPYAGHEYVVLLPADEPEESVGEVVILELEDCQSDSNVESYVSVASEVVLNAVFDIFKSNHRNLFEFTD